MIDTSFIIENLFRLLNLGVLVWVGLYVIKLYVLPSVKEEIKQKNSQELALHKEFKDLGTRHDEQQLKLEYQEKECEQLQKKVLSWRLAFDEQQKFQQQQSKQFMQRIEEKVKIQQECVLTELTIKTVVPQAIEKTRDELSSYFSSPKNTQSFMTQLFDFMERRRV